MADFIEHGKRPADKYPCYIQCPHCGKWLDYWDTAFQTGLDDIIEIDCLNPVCKEKITVKGTVDKCFVVLPK